MIETPRTNTAAYNGHKYLRDECAALEIENRKLRASMLEAIEAGEAGDWQSARNTLKAELANTPSEPQARSQPKI